MEIFPNAFLSPITGFHIKLSFLLVNILSTIIQPQSKKFNLLSQKQIEKLPSLSTWEKRDGENLGKHLRIKYALMLTLGLFFNVL